MNINKIKNKLVKLSYKIIAPLIIISQKIILPGFDKLPLYDVIVFFIKGVNKGAFTDRAQSIAFRFFIALFPAIIFVFTLIPYIPIHNLQDNILGVLQSAMPDSIFNIVNSTITDIVKRQHNGLLSIGFILALYFASNGIRGMIVSFNNTYHAVETRSIVYQYLIAFVLLFILVFVVIISVLLLIAGTWGIKYLAVKGIINGSLDYYLLKYGKWILIITIVFFAISFIYYLAPVKKERFRFISAGSTLATFLFALNTWGFNIYINNFSRYNVLYGSIGTFIVLLLWLYFNSFVLLLGFELNTSIIKARLHKSKNLKMSDEEDDIINVEIILKE